MADASIEQHIVEYSPRFGGVCACGQTNTRIYATEGWVLNVRLRRHECETCGKRFQSVDVDKTCIASQILAKAMN